MWAITTYYNPVRYRRRLANYRSFRARLQVPIVTVELSFGGGFELTEEDADVLVRIPGGAVLWQKERLLNVALQSVPPGVASVAWLDCDVIFGRTDWVAEAAARLRDLPIVQLFSDLVDLGPDDHRPPPHDASDITGRGIVSLVADGALRPSDFAPTTTQHMRSGAFGLAWAARRELLAGHGFYDAMIVGSGDRSMVCAMYGRFGDLVRSLDLNEARQRHYLRWARPFHEAVAGRVGHVPGRLYHLWHGDLQDRRYRERHRRFAELDFDPERDLRIAPGGAWEWARPRPELARFLADYFVGRAEDGRAPCGSRLPGAEGSDVE